MTRRSVVYTVLRERANEWTSGNTLVAAGAGYRFSARIYELRQAGRFNEWGPQFHTYAFGRHLVLHSTNGRERN
jgi:hypothetical protein